MTSVSDERTRHPAPGRLRALYDWLAGTTPASDASIPSPGDQRLPPARIGRYTIERPLGKGGMGIVYQARDEQLDRRVALKTMASLARDEQARSRFAREARAAASVSHPNVCQIYEIGEDGGELFIAMELLEGETLAERLRQGTLSVSQTVPVGLSILAALSALHARGVIHRDLKPSNVFLTPHGPKLLDFGLARSETGHALTLSTGLTAPGVIMGTPRYMAPEQITGDTVDARADLFAAGAILFEMLAGRPAFIGQTVIAILHATVNEQPPALTGPPAVVAVDRVIRRALAKRPADRPSSADAMAAQLAAAAHIATDDTPIVVRALTRLVVLPFRMLRPDAETDFLAFSLADAVATSLSSRGGLIVRSSATAARFAADAPDLQAIAAAADVDRVVTGTLLRAEGQLRVTAQLVEAPSGTLLTSQTVQTSLGNLFQLQDDLARRIVEALSLPLVGGHATPPPDAPQDGQAYELYLRANEQGRTYSKLAAARELYERCLELDPSFAPAWAQLGRCYRVMGKFIDGAPDSERRAEAAFRRALELNSRLAIAHKFYANLQADLGQAEQAVAHLLDEARHHSNDPELFVGLVHALRYCGLHEQSVAAHTEACRLDPHIPTSIELTQLMAGTLEGLLAVDPPPPVRSDDDRFTRIMGLGLTGRREEARRLLADMGRMAGIPVFEARVRFLTAWLDVRPEDMRASWTALGAFKIHDDPEAIFQAGWMFCDTGEPEQGLALIQRAVAKNYYAADTLTRSKVFDSLRRDPFFRELLHTAEGGRHQALDTFRAGGGEVLLGVKAKAAALGRAGSSPDDPHTPRAPR